MVGRSFKTWFLPSPAHDAYALTTSTVSGEESVTEPAEVDGTSDHAENIPALTDTNAEIAVNEEVADDATGNESGRASRARPPSESRAIDSSTFNDLVKEPESSEERMSRVRRFEDETGAE